MFIIVRNPVYRLVALGVSLAIFLILYFAVIKPNNDSANNAVSQAERNAQQQLHQAQKDGAAIPPGVTNLVNCIAAAGTDASQLQACRAKFHP